MLVLSPVMRIGGTVLVIVIDIPVIFVGSGLDYPAGSCLSRKQPDKVGSDEATILCMEHHGHLDVYPGTHSLEMVKKTLLEWMNDRLQLTVPFCEERIDCGAVPACSFTAHS